ncbi:MAG: flagellar motor switch phosphatase FliY [Lachnospiraceae bacterium]|nr:flagellar motor switch phosphatase FliY [Lachnospiraceae bacterium]
MDGMLSQEEINALLGGMGDSEDDTTTTSEKEINDVLTLEEKDAIGEISNISMGSAATALSSLVNKRVLITTPKVSYCTWDDVASAYDRPCVFVQISYKEGVDGNNNLILREEDVKVITDLMMGGDGKGTIDELSVLHISAIGEAMNQMMGSAATSLSSMLGKKIDINPPVANLVDLNGSIEEKSISDLSTGSFVKVAFRMEIDELVDSEIMQLYPVDTAKDLYKSFLQAQGITEEPASQGAAAPQSAPAPAAPSMQPQSSQPQPDPMAMQGQPAMQMPPQGMGMPMYGQPYMGMPPQGYGYAMPPVQDMNVQPVQFQAFSPMAGGTALQENIDLIKDVPLEVTVELGKTKKSIKEILEIGPGTIIELDKITGEPIDILVNGKLVAKGEVVVIEESFGVRVTDILK